MSRPGKFSNSSFHKEGRLGNITSTSAKVTPPKSGPDAEFYEEIVQTGRVNWKKAPKAVKTRYTGIWLVLVSIPLLLIPSWEMYRRLEGTSTRKVRQGELLDGQEVREFDETEKWKVEKEGIIYKIFGKDWFLDGFTSKTMKKNDETNEKK